MVVCAACGWCGGLPLVVCRPSAVAVGSSRSTAAVDDLLLPLLRFRCHCHWCQLQRLLTVVFTWLTVLQAMGLTRSARYAPLLTVHHPGGRGEVTYLQLKETAGGTLQPLQPVIHTRVSG
jgi:hypothetical protein